MGVLKDKAVFVSIDKFLCQAVKEVGLLVGLHPKLMHWTDLQTKLEQLVNCNEDETLPIETLQKMFGLTMMTKKNALVHRSSLSRPQLGTCPKFSKH